MSAKSTTKPRRRAARSRDPKRGKADLDRIRRVSEAEIRRTSPPELEELPADFWDDAVVVVPDSKVPISLRVDSDVLAWFRARGPRYQSRINAVLRSYMKGIGREPRTKPRVLK
ncbi:MAG: BrnA antitoxin family protein [Gemmatimonadaceae bacterium]|nr:BrnA antitoxin family protein [Gemmatimonadaceae bacterium]